MIVGPANGDAERGMRRRKQKPICNLNPQNELASWHIKEKNPGIDK